MATYASATKTTAEKSRQEIESTLKRYGASAFAFGWDNDHVSETIQFRLNGREIRLQVRKPQDEDQAVKKQLSIAKTRTKGDILDAVRRQRWRAMALFVKALCEAIEEGVVTVDEAFMSGIVMPDNRTMGQHGAAAIERFLLEGRLPPLLPG